MKIFGPGGIRVKTQGSAELKFGINKKNIDNPSLPIRNRKTTMMDFDEKINLNVNGKVGDKVNMNLNYNTDATFDFDAQNMKLKYDGKEDEIIKLVERLTHPEIAKLKGNSLTQGTSLNREDSFVKNYKSSKPSGFNRQKAYLLKLEKVPDGEFGLIHGMMPVSQLKQVCHRYGVSINDYLVACFVWSVYQECFHGMPNDMPVRVAVPVNLRPYFDSVTTKNFFVMISAEFRPQNSSYTFEEVLKIVTDSINSQISKEHLEDLFSYSVSNQKNILMRPVPLFIKNLAMKAVYTQSALANTTTITNIGNIKVEPEYEPYITGFYSFIPMSKGQPMKGTICSYKDTLVFTFSSILADTMIQRSFFKKLVNDGVEVTIETNGEYYD